MDLEFVDRRMPTKRPFTISRGTQTEAHSLFLRARIAGRPTFGYGEVPLDAKVTLEDAKFQLRQAVRHLFPLKGDRSEDFANPLGARAGPVACGLDTALVDLQARLAGKSLPKHLGIAETKLPTSGTVSIDTPRAMAEEARHLLESRFPILKVKLGGPGGVDEDAKRLGAVRDAAPRVPIRVDANTAWTPEGARQMLPALRKAEVEFVEQPFPQDAVKELVSFQREAEVSIAADESAQNLSDVKRLAELGFGERRGEARGIVNIKIGKFGGPRPSLAAAKAAKAAGMGVFLGCFLESPVGIAGAASLLGVADYADLDGAWILANPPFGPDPMRDGVVHAPTKPGLGVEPEAGLFPPRADGPRGP